MVSELSFEQTDVLLFTLKKQAVKNVFLSEAMMFGYEEHEAKKIYFETFDVLARHFQNARMQCEL